MIPGTHYAQTDTHTCMETNTQTEMSYSRSLNILINAKLSFILYKESMNFK